MLVSERKPMEEIKSFLAGEDKVFLLGCDGCAAASGTGGEQDILELKGELEKEGLEIVGWKVIEFLCQKALVRRGLKPYASTLGEADSILVSTCGIGVQATATVMPMPVHPACDTISLGGIRGEWQGEERCLECGQCFLEITGGICPLTACTKQLVNGPCGGAKDGRCEFEPEARPCGWQLIYERLKSLDRLDVLRQTPPQLKDFAQMQPPKEIRSTSKWAVDIRAKEEVAAT